MGGDYNTISQAELSPRERLNKEALASLGGTPNDKNDRLRDYAESLKSGLLSARKRNGLHNEDDDQSLNRFPQIQKSRAASQFKEDILSRRSRATGLSKMSK